MPNAYLCVPEDRIWRGRRDFSHKFVLPLTHHVCSRLPVTVNVQCMSQLLCIHKLEVSRLHRDTAACLAVKRKISELLQR